MYNRADRSFHYHWSKKCHDDYIGTAGSHPSVSKLTFFLGSNYLLTAFKSPYTFSLTSSRFVDGAYNLSVTASLSDGRSASPAAINLTFANGVTTSPTNPMSFSPYAPASPGQPFVVAATGGGASGEHPEVTDQIATWNPGIMPYLGDVYEKGNLYRVQ
jgi:hypothetical protein